MGKPTHDQIEKLITQVVLPFYHVQRDMPLPLGERRIENDAEHSWSLAFVACALAPEVDPKLDLGRICQFAIVHDLVEVYAGDTAVHGDPAHVATKDAREAAAGKKLAREFAYLPWITQTLDAYNRKDTDEALFVYALDKYLPVFFDYLDQAKLFRERGYSLERYNKELEKHRVKAHSHPAVGKYYDEVRELLNAHPEYFHPGN
jgi:5'-deoxynucleotidase YfbR-like HD superfamily hydrolase